MMLSEKRFALFGFMLASSLKNDNAGMLGLVVGLYMDRDQGVLNLRLDRTLKPVADIVRLGDAHLTFHHEVEIDECHAAGLACAQIMRLDRAIGIGGNDRANACQIAFRQGLIQ